MPLHEPGCAWLVMLSAGFVLGQGSLVVRRQAARVVLWTGRIMAVLMLLVGSAHVLGDRLLVRGVEAEDPEVLSKARQYSLASSRAMQHEAAVRLLREEVPEAHDLVQEALRIRPSPSGWVLLGRVHMAQHRFDEAAEAFSEAVRLHPRLFAGHYNLALAYEAAGDRFEARRHAERARSLRPSDKRLRNLPR